MFCDVKWEVTKLNKLKDCNTKVMQGYLPKNSLLFKYK